jgi:pSer/pThr/pTyr-binding forkhead associated (FHA) protein
VIRIGRHSGNDFVLNDRAGDEFHCVIHQQDGEYWIEDKQTRYGTRVNGQRIDKTRLRAGDELQIGFTRIDWEDLLGIKKQVEVLQVTESEQAVQREESPELLMEISIPKAEHAEITGKLEIPEKKSGSVAATFATNPYPHDLAPVLAKLTIQKTSEPETDIPAPLFTNAGKSELEIEPSFEAVKTIAQKISAQPKTRRKLSDDERLMLITLGIMAVMTLVGLLIGSAAVK